MSIELQSLIVAAQAGDDEAFNELVRRTYTETYTLAYRLMGNPDDAADVVQETYLRAFRSLGRFRGDAQFSTWLYRITANCASTHRVRRGRHRHDPLEEQFLPVDVSNSPESKADSSVDRAVLTAAIEQLPANLRSVLILKDVYDLPHEAIAEELGISEVTAKVRLHRARKKLRDRLQLTSREESDVKVG